MRQFASSAAPCALSRLLGTRPGHVLFLQARCDAILSCGGAAALFADAGWETHLVTVFAADGEQLQGAPTRQARRQHGAAGSGAVSLRRAEDASAAAVLGCGARWLGLPAPGPQDARFATFLARCGIPEKAQCELALFIAIEVLRLDQWHEGTHVFVPLAAGASMDGHLVFEAGRTLASYGAQVWAYEDLPCAIEAPGNLRARVRQFSSALGAPILLPIDSVLHRKLDAIACHARRLPAMFPCTADYRTAVADHARELGAMQAHACERFWQVRG